MTCLVCGARQSESHFGGISCRACAAFFRRYFNSKKFVIKCTCKTRTTGSHACRSCRVAKCFAVGMTPQKLCGQRDSNGSPQKHSSPPSLALTIHHLSPKDTTNITTTLPTFSSFEAKRIHMFSSLGLQNVFGITSLTKNDVHLTDDLVTNVFPEFGKLSASDKRSMINGFILKLWQIEPALDHVAKRIQYKKMEEKDVQDILFPFFHGSFPSGGELSDQEIWRIFGHHWVHYFEKVIEPIVALSLDQTELMAIIWILFFDHAYIDIGQKGTDLCWTIRKVIYRELRNYLIEKMEEEESADTRFMTLLDIPVIVERAEQKFLDECLICEMHQIRVHDDFRAIVKKQRI